MREAFLAGQIVARRYRLEALLGEGGMGAVWRAHDLNLGSTLALKLLDPEHAESAEARARFEREARAAAALRSPHVVQIIEYGIHDSRFPFIAMELLEGETLGERLERAEGKPLPYDEVCRILTHVARAVGKAHDGGIVHRDLKPENIFLVKNDDEEIAKVLDFGIAKDASTIREGTSSSHTVTGALLGTPNYMSPEQAHGNKTIDFRSDIWSIGVIGFECVTGQAPFRSPALGELVLMICTGPIPVPSRICAVPPAFDVWFSKSAARDVNHRFQSAREQASALRAALLGTADASDLSGPHRLQSSPGSSGMLPVAQAYGAAGERPLVIGAARATSQLNETANKGALSFGLTGREPLRRGRRIAMAIVAVAILIAALLVVIFRSARLGQEAASPLASESALAQTGAHPARAATTGAAASQPVVAPELASAAPSASSTAASRAPATRPAPARAVQQRPRRQHAANKDDLGI